MKKFFIKSSIFVFVFLAVTFFLQETIFFGVKTINVGEYGVLNRIVDGKINADILISGSSRTFKGINPKVIQEVTGFSTYNISSDGVGIEIQLPKFKMYLNHNKKPKILIQDASALGGFAGNSIFQPYKYLPYASDDDFSNGLQRIDENFWIHKYFPPSNLLYFNFDFYLEFFNELQLSMQGKEKYVKGFYPDNSVWATSLEQLKLNRPNGLKTYLTEEYKIYLNELIDICREKEITLILTVLPYYYEIYEIVDEVVDVDSFYKYTAKNTKALYWNYSNSEIADSTKYFYNFTHLNKKGANTFSEILARDINQLLAE